MISLSYFRDILSICTRCHAASLYPPPSLSTFDWSFQNSRRAIFKPHEKPANCSTSISESILCSCWKVLILVQVTGPAGNQHRKITSCLGPSAYCVDLRTLLDVASAQNQPQINLPCQSEPSLKYVLTGSIISENIELCGVSSW